MARSALRGVLLACFFRIPANVRLKQCTWISDRFAEVLKLRAMHTKMDCNCFKRGAELLKLCLEVIEIVAYNIKQHPVSCNGTPSG
jgi:hypothetical protein